ncbi:MAG: hypothetical protein RL609_1927 [Bacteroidota bacterium]|jgi:hypothetical protein
MKKYIFALWVVLTSTGIFAQNWSQDIAPILFDHCTQCHHPGGIGPSSLMTYDDAYNSSASILSAISTGYMPPYPANTNYRHFMNENVLSDVQKQNITDWVVGGAPSGDLSLAPAPPVYNNSSQLNQIDFTGTTPLNTSLAVGSDYYRTFVLSPNYTTDTFIDGIEIIPGNSDIVHHVVIYYDPTDACLSLDGADGMPGFQTNGTGGGIPTDAYFVGAWVPGKGPQFLPFGFGIRASAGGHFLVEMHYPAGSNGQQDQTIVNIQHTQDPSPREAWYNPILTHDPATLDEPALIIPANTQQTFHATYNVPTNVSLIGITPHMHLIGKSIRSFALNAGDTIPLIDIPNWDFHWQLGYDYPQLIKVPMGAQLKAVATYDNTVNNPNQPSFPPQLVMWGEETTDEMMVVFYLYTYYLPGDENIIVQHNTGVIENGPTPESTWDFYPNPSTGQFYWTSFQALSSQQVVRIFNNQGQLVKEDVWRMHGGINQGQLDLQALPQGLYHVQFLNKKTGAVEVQSLIIE